MPNANSQGGARGRVLIVDDIAENREILSYYLQKAGFEVAEVLDGYLALKSVCGGVLKKCEGASCAYDVVLMDMSMPRIDGYETVRMLRGHGWRMPIIAVTAHTLKGDREKCLAAGCDEYLGKPVEPARLVALCAELVAKHKKAA